MGWLINEQNEIHVIFPKKNHRFIWSTKRRSLIRIKPIQFLYNRIIDELVDFILNKYIQRRDNCSDTDNTLVLAMHRPCWGFFVDRHDRWYCSLRRDHRVIRYSFVPYIGRGENLLGNGTHGSSSRLLHSPTAIYVNDDNFDLYIADTGNNRVQLLKDGQSKGRTFVGEDGEIKFKLHHPTGLAMDKSGHLYILQHSHRRILRCWQTKCDCIIEQAQEDSFYHASHLAFDSHKNLLVLDEGRRRIQRFNLTKNSCCKYSHFCSVSNR